MGIKLKCIYLADKKVLYINKVYDSLFEEGKYYTVKVKSVEVKLKCIRTAKAKVLYVNSTFSDLFDIGQFYIVSAKPVQEVSEVKEL